MDGQQPITDIDRLVHDLTFSPHLYIDPAHMDAHMPRGVWDVLRQGPRGLGRLDAFVVKSLGLLPLLPEQTRALADGTARLWLLPGAALTTLVRYTGLALNAATIASVIDRDGRKRLKEALSSEEYEFTLRSAPLLTKRRATRPVDATNDNDIMAAIDAEGWAFLSHALAGLPESLTQRVLAKLPVDGPWTANLPENAADDDKKAAFTLARKLSREVAPQWAGLFA